MDEQIIVQIYVGDCLITEKIINGCDSHWFESCPFHDNEEGCNIGGTINYNASSIPSCCPLRRGNT